MNLQTVEGTLTLSFDLVSTTALAGLLLMFGYFMRKKFSFLEKYCIPAPVIGGLIFAILAWILKINDVMVFSLDTTLQTPFMVAFFACVGFGGSFALLKSGGKSLIVFLVLCWIMAIIQNSVGVGLAKVLGINPVLGVMAGAVSLTGGHGNAAAFGPEAEALGVVGATTVAVAAATYGLIIGSLSGGPLGRFLINKFKVPIKSNTEGIDIKAHEANMKQKEGNFSAHNVMKHMTIVGVFMVIGGFFVTFVKMLKIPNFALPQYVGAMFVAIIFRNLNDKFKIIEVDSKVIDLIKEIGLGFFLTMAIMTLKIWELADLEIPLLVILAVQTIIVFAYILFIVWPLMKKDYDAAVMCAGFTGVGLGVTATAVASMSAVCETYKENSFKAFLIVPLCCAVFIDIVAIPCIVFFMSYFA